MLLLLGNVNRFFATEAAFALCSAARSQRSSTMVDRKIKDPTGLSKKEIAKKLHISANTVDNHTNHLMTKLNIHDRVGLARLAIREGLVSA